MRFNLRGRTLPYRHPIRWLECLESAERYRLDGRLMMSAGQVYHLRYGKTPRRVLRVRKRAAQNPPQPPRRDVTVYV